MLLGFSCRNRLLLSGTPIQNSMAELWALLHFIMPTLFDSHDEFNEWFSKDIESHAENKTGIDESKYLLRMHVTCTIYMNFIFYIFYLQTIIYFRTSVSFAYDFKTFYVAKNKEGRRE